MSSSDQFNDIVRLLERRAEALKPDEDLIDSAIRRCERYQLAHGSGDDIDRIDAESDEESANGTAISADDAATGTATGEPSLGGGEREGLSVANTMQDSRQAEEHNQQYREVAKKHAAQKRKRKMLKPGTEIQGYRIIGLVGKGGMGQVYRALQLSMNREVAFKVLSPRYAESKSFRARFIREAHSAGRLHHRHLIAVHDVDETPDGLLFFSMELVDGKSVADMIDDTGPLEEAESLRIIRQTLEALGYAHERNVIHRDIKPDNIIIDSEGSVKVADLGLSRVDEDGEKDGRVTAANTMMGTPYYMSPEQSRDAHTVDHRTDLYSVGATLYHMICGDVPFDGETPLDVVVAASTDKLEFIDPQPSSGVKRFIRMMMAKDPRDRPQTAHAALELLQRLEEDPRASLRSPNSTKMLVSIAILVLVLMLIVIALMSEERVQVSDEHSAEQSMIAPGNQANVSSVNLFETFYFDAGQVASHAGDFSTFSGEGHATTRFESLLGDGDDGLHLQILTDQLQRVPERNIFVMQLRLKKDGRGGGGGLRARLQMPTLMFSSKGILCGVPAAGRDRRERNEQLQKIADYTSARMLVNISTDGRRVDVYVRGQEEQRVALELDGEIESIDLRWQLRQPLSLQLRRVTADDKR